MYTQRLTIAAAKEDAESHKDQRTQDPERRSIRCKEELFEAKEEGVCAES